jgi:GTPase SAR1 family protein
MEFLKQEDLDTEKILFTGLDNAGKTSIILALKREFSKIATISPTRGAQRRIFKFLGRNISEWDLGGQELYRISYIKNPSKYFDNTEVCIFCIDIRNKNRIPESLSYLDDVIKKFQELGINPPIYIFFHKYDPALERSALNEYSELIINLKEDIKKASNYKRLYFYKTSVYDIAGLIQVISEIFLTLIERPKLLKQTLKEFANRENCDGAVIIDNNSLIISSYFTEEETEEVLNLLPAYFLRLNDQFNRIGDDMELPIKFSEDKIIVERFSKFYYFTQINEEYYLLFVKDSPTYEDESVIILSKFLNKFI